jgi:hypothetical protein
MRHENENKKRHDGFQDNANYVRVLPLPSSKTMRGSLSCLWEYKRFHECTSPEAQLVF